MPQKSLHLNVDCFITLCEVDFLRFPLWRGPRDHSSFHRRVGLGDCFVERSSPMDPCVHWIPDPPEPTPDDNARYRSKGICFMN